MRRAISGGLLTAALLLALPPAARAQTPSSIINGMGLVDFRFKPTFKTGDWVRYRVVGTNTTGVSENYTITVLIAGQQVLWGDSCFWVETWTESPGFPAGATAALVSYASFGDSLAASRVQQYSRAIIVDSNEEGLPVARITRQPASSFKQRTPRSKGPTVVTDTVATDTVLTPRGEFQARIVEIKSGTGVESTGPDSSAYLETFETRRRALGMAAPITHILSEHIERTIKRQAWMAGRSREDAPQRVEEEANTEVRLIDFGTGLEPRLLPNAVTPGGAKIWHPSAAAGPGRKTSTPARRGG